MWQDCGKIGRIGGGLWEECERVIGGVCENCARIVGGMCKDCGELWKACWRIVGEFKRILEGSGKDDGTFV